MTYRQRMHQLDEVLAGRARNEAADAAEEQRLSQLSEFECYAEGYKQGYEDARDGYTAEVSVRAERYPFGESFAAGYWQGHEANV